MFNCDLCGVPTGPRVPPVVVVLHTRRKEYHQTVASDRELAIEKEAEAIVTFGFEIDEEAKVCPPCGETTFGVPKVKPRGAELIAHGFEEPMARLGRFSLCSRVVESMIDRTTHDSKRAKADVAAAYPLLKTYEQMGGRL